MSMKASGPSLIPIARTRSFIDYNELTASEKAKYSKNCEDFIKEQTIKCKSGQDYFKCMAAMREKRRLLALNNDFQGADKVDELIRQLSDYFIENHMYTSKVQLVDVVNYQLSSQRERLFNAEEKWENSINEAKEQYANELRQLEDSCSMNLERYDNSIPEELPAKYSKLSSDLLNLREQEKHLIGSRRFVEADKYHREFERRKEVELNSKKREYFESSEKRRKEIEVINAKKISALRDLWERRISELECSRDKEVAPLAKAVDALERKYSISKSEYIGQDDPIPESVVFESKQVPAPELKASGTFRSRDLVSFESSITPRNLSGIAGKPGKTLRGEERPLKRGVVGATNKKKADVLRKQGTVLDSSRWPK